jgi:hypothetical protein
MAAAHEKKPFFAVSRRYPRLNTREREGLADAVRDELTPRIDDAAGLHVFAVTDENDVLTSVAMFANRGAAESFARRPAKNERLRPEKADVVEIPPRKP